MKATTVLVLVFFVAVTGFTVFAARSGRVEVERVQARYDRCILDRLGDRNYCLVWARQEP